MKNKLMVIVTSVLMVIGLTGLIASPVMAVTTATVAMTATGAFISISVSPTSYGFGTVATSSTTSTTTSYFSVTNNSSVTTSVTIAVTASTWTGGVAWTHSDTATPGADTCGLKANQNGAWGTGDVIVKYASPNNIVSTEGATTNWSFGLKLLAPTSFSDGVQKTNTVILTATTP
jgi:hypothetical protein